MVKELNGVEQDRLRVKIVDMQFRLWNTNHLLNHYQKD